MRRCARCDNERKTVWVFHPTMAFPPFVPQESVRPTEAVCGECLSDTEIVGVIGPIAEFAIRWVINNVERNDPPNKSELLKSLDVAHAPFFTKTNEPDNSNRRSTLRLLGLVA